MLCSNRTSSCDFLAEDRREQEGYQNSGSFGENSWGDFAGVNPLSFACEAIVAKHGHVLPYRMAVTAFLAFCQHLRRAFSILRHCSRWRNIGYPLEQQITLCEDLGHHATLLALKHPSRTWCLDCFRPIPDGFNHREHWRPGRYLDVDYCTASPCNARSR